jgi:hypothetical protein
VNRKLKKYNLKYEYLKLDDEDTKEELQRYIDEFNDRFNKYYQMPVSGSTENEVWVNEETGEVRDEAPPAFEDDFKTHYDNFKKEQAERDRLKKEKLKELNSRPDKLKKLYKKLAAKVHPDMEGGSNKLFQIVNEAYENNNLMTLLTKAGEYEIEYEVDNSDERVLEQNLKQLEKEILRMKDTIAWTWATGDINAKKFVIKRVEDETGHKVEVEDLPDELKPEKTEDVKLLNKDSE